MISVPNHQQLLSGNKKVKIKLKISRFNLIFETAFLMSQLKPNQNKLT